MSTEFLDKTGLAYFWSKIKAWAVAAFAAISHSHASQDVTAMTGYSKPGSSSAIAVGDTLNQAIGKLEYKVDAYDDSNYVHKTGDELIDGYKGFNSIYVAKRLAGVTRGTIPQTTQYSDWAFDDVDGYLLGSVELACRSASNTEYGNSRADLKLWCKPVDANPGDLGAALVVGWDDQGRRFAACPSTQSGRTFGNDILTRDWIPNDTRIVHTSGDEDIAGYKTFTTRHPIKIKCGVTAGTTPSSNYYSGLRFVDNNGRVLSYIEYAYYSSGECSIKFEIDSVTANTYDTLGIYRDAGDLPYATAPSTRTDRSGGSDIVTRNWIPNDTRIVHTSGAENVAGSKTFTDHMYLKRINPYIYFVETDWQKGTPQSDSATSYQGLHFQDKNGVDACTILYNYYQSKNSALVFSTKRMDSASASGSVEVYIAYDADGTKYVRPDGNGSVLLGRSGNRWKEIWCTQSSINSSSDARLKQAVSDVPSGVLDAWEDARWVQFKFSEAVEEKGFENARLHAGLVAQDLDAAFRARGLDIGRYGLFLYDEWDETPEERDAEGNVVGKYEPAGNAYGLRYVEALCVEAAYMRRENARLKKRVADLEDRLAALELRLGSA